MCKRLFLAIGAMVLALQFSPAVSAGIIYDNGGPAVILPGGSQMSDTYQGQDFIVSSATNLTSVTFWSLEGVPADFTGSIFYQIVNDAAGSPGLTVLDSGTRTGAGLTRTAAGTALGFTQFQNDFAVSALGVTPGTYWLLLHNGPLGTTAFSDFYWSWADLNGTNTPTNRGQEKGLAPVTGWTTTDAEAAFNVSGTLVSSGVPEPGTIGLSVAGLGLLALWRKRVMNRN